MTQIHDEKIGQNWGKSMSECNSIIKTFDDGKWGCPWMQYWNSLHRGQLPTSGIFLMQDWGCENETLEEATSDLEGWFQDSSTADKTIRNVLENRKWREAFKNREWLITNAVWGLRINAEKCGYLGDCVHKKGYTLIWRDLVISAALASSNPNFQLIVAGEWSWFKGDPSTMSLAHYIGKWDAFSKFPCTPKTIPGQVLHCAHPSMWQWKGFKDGPP